jgi:hypothetical protein
MRHETLRDPVQHDITITALERSLIDTGAFQRLRLLKQLGPTHLVYPGAVHTRFVHSLGTLQVAERLVQTANANYSVYNHTHLVEITPYPHLLIRLSALLHDVAHIPYGHTLEDEGNLFTPEWEDHDRAEHWLGEDAEIPTQLRAFLTSSGISHDNAKRVAIDLRTYIVHKGDPTTLPYPYAVDFVGNTICADLLDYLYRDMYFCGLTERCGDRATQYMAVVRVAPKTQADAKQQTQSGEFQPTGDQSGKGRAALLTYRLEHAHTGRPDMRVIYQSEILSEVIDLLRRRFALAEKVFFHRTKLAASAMLISAVGSSSLSCKDLYGCSDESLLNLLMKDANPRVRRLADAYNVRRLYKPAFRINYREEIDSDAFSKRLWRFKYPEYRTPDWRRRTEEELEEYADLPTGSVVIYCPDKEMNIKGFKMLVQTRPEGEVKRLEQILDTNRRFEMEALNRPYAHLWRLFVFVDPKALDVSYLENPRVHDFNGLCESIFECHNGIDALRAKGRSLDEQVVARVIHEFESSDQGNCSVPYAVSDELRNAVHRRSDSRDLLKALREHLRIAMDDTQDMEDKDFRLSSD